jgi:hypothetical protein
MAGAAKAAGTAKERAETDDQTESRQVLAACGGSAGGMWYRVGIASVSVMRPDREGALRDASPDAGEQGGAGVQA